MVSHLRRNLLVNNKLCRISITFLTARTLAMFTHKQLYLQELALGGTSVGSYPYGKGKICPRTGHEGTERE
jgi:hypothetical protein